MIGICGEVGKVDFAFQIVSYMMSMHIPPNSHTFSALIETCSRAGDYRRAMHVLHEMRSSGWSPNAATQDAILFACARSTTEPLASLSQMLDQQRHDGRPTSPNTAVELVTCVAGAGRYADAVELFGLLSLEAVQPSERCVHDALHSLKQSVASVDQPMPEPLRRLLQLLTKMTGRSPSPHQATAGPAGGAPPSLPMGNAPSGSAGGGQGPPSSLSPHGQPPSAPPASALQPGAPVWQPPAPGASASPPAPSVSQQHAGQAGAAGNGGLGGGVMGEHGRGGDGSADLRHDLDEGGFDGSVDGAGFETMVGNLVGSLGMADHERGGRQ